MCYSWTLIKTVRTRYILCATVKCWTLDGWMSYIMHLKCQKHYCCILTVIYYNIRCVLKAHNSEVPPYPSMRVYCRSGVSRAWEKIKLTQYDVSIISRHMLFMYTVFRVRAETLKCFWTHGHKTFLFFFLLFLLFFSIPLIIPLCPCARAVYFLCAFPFYFFSRSRLFAQTIQIIK